MPRSASSASSAMRPRARGSRLARVSGAPLTDARADGRASRVSWTCVFWTGYPPTPPRPRARSAARQASIAHAVVLEPLAREPVPDHPVAVGTSRTRPPGAARAGSRARPRPRSAGRGDAPAPPREARVDPPVLGQGPAAGPEQRGHARRPEHLAEHAGRTQRPPRPRREPREPRLHHRQHRLRQTSSIAVGPCSATAGAAPRDRRGCRRPSPKGARPPPRAHALAGDLAEEPLARPSREGLDADLLHVAPLPEIQEGGAHLRTGQRQRKPGSCDRSFSDSSRKRTVAMSAHWRSSSTVSTGWAPHSASTKSSQAARICSFISRASRRAARELPGAPRHRRTPAISPRNRATRSALRGGT